MTREEWARVTDLFGDALDLETDVRAAFLSDLRLTDPAAAVEVESLLEAHERPGAFRTGAPALPAAPPTGDLSGRALGAYRLQRLLGSGGMGAVYLAERSDGAFVKDVAIKLLSPAFAHARGRFHREREFLARLDHPNIARLLDGGTSEEGWPYLVMEYVDGEPIDRFVRERGLAVDARLALLQQVCGGVAHAHQRLIVHCDIKPENILVTPDGTAKLLDFGIARLLELDGHVTQFRAATPACSSPEQLQGHVVTTASDVYAIGVLGYLVCAGSGPYILRSSEPLEAVQAALESEPVAASRLPGLPPGRARELRGDLENILVKAVAKDPNRRYPSALQLAEDIDAFRHGYPVRARRDTVGYRLRRFAGRHRIACAAAAIAVVALVSAAAFSTWQARIAARRLEDLRAFAGAIVFDVDEQLRAIPGTTAARRLVVDTALRYLDRASLDEYADPALRAELAAAYVQMGKVQGGAFMPNLGDTSGAIRSFDKAIATIGPSPGGHALERLRIEAHNNRALLETDPIAGAPSFERAIAAGDRLVRDDPADVQTLRLMAQAYHGLATIAHVTDRLPDHVRAVGLAIALRERVVAAGTGRWQDQADLAREYGQDALARLQDSDPAGALERLQRGQRVIEAAIAGAPGNQVLVRGLAEIRARAGVVLTMLGRYAEADSELRAAVDLLSPLVASDADNRQYRADLAFAWLRLGDLRRAEGRLSEALGWHRQALEVRRARAAADPSFMFVPWELTSSLNAVGDLLLDLSDTRASDAQRLFDESRRVAEETLARAPSFNELRKQLALAYEGLARAALALRPDDPRAIERLRAAVAVWRDVRARSVGDRRQEEHIHEVEARLVALDGGRP